MVDISRPSIRSVAVPAEHGGWSLTLEPALLGLIIAFSPAGVALAAVALLGFVARSPLRLMLVDRQRGRRLPRTALAARVFSAEAAIGLVLVAAAVATAEAAFWWPLLPAVPLVAVELWHDMRSRSRRLVAELAGSIGMGSIAAMVALAGGTAAGTAAGLWLVMAARSLATVPFVRVQLLRFKQRPYRSSGSDWAQVAAVVLVGAGWTLRWVPVGGLVAIAILAAFELVAVRRPAVKVALIGAQQVVMGLTVVLITGLAVLAP